MTDYKVEFIPISELKPYPENTKIHTEKQIKQIAESIRQFGFRQNIVVDKSGVIVIGHGRFEAARLLGYDSVPCVRVEDLTDEQIKALRIVDNKTNESEWDFDNLNLELESLEGLFDFEPFDLSLDGFDDEAEQDKHSPTSGGVYERYAKLEAWNKGTCASKVISEAVKRVKKTPDGKGKLTLQLIHEVSGYAKQNRSETLAECVADYVANGSKAKPLSREVWSILKRELG